MPKYIQQERNNAYLSSNSNKLLRFASRCASFEAKNGVHYVQSVKCKKIAFKRQSIPNRREITLFFLQNRVKRCILGTVVLVWMLKQTCVGLAHLNRANIAFKCRNISNRNEITLIFPQTRINCCDLQAAVLLSKLKTACTTFNV